LTKVGQIKQSELPRRLENLPYTHPRQGRKTRKKDKEMQGHKDRNIGKVAKETEREKKKERHKKYRKHIKQQKKAKKERKREREREREQKKEQNNMMRKKEEDDSKTTTTTFVCVSGHR
jgi:hypothetical protein